MHLDFWETLSQLLVLLAVALALGAAFERFRQSAVLGFLLAGTLMGPGGFGVVSNQDVVSTVGELGVALLLFVIGLEFSLRRLVRIGAVGLGGGTAQVVLTTALGAGVAKLAGFDWNAAVAIGAIGALSSTACVIRVLTDRASMESVYGRASLGILLLQDLAVVPLVLVVAAVGGSGSFGQIAQELGRAVLVIVGMVAAFYVFSNFVLPRVLQSTVAQRNRELLILLAALVALGSAWVSHELGLSPALGAFLAGLMLAESPFALQVRADVGSLRALFATLFFVSIGMFGDPRWIAEHWVAVVGATGFVVAGKFVLITLITRCFGLNWRTATATGLCLAQVGEFSFVIAQVAHGSGGSLIDQETFKLLASATLVSLFLTPYMVSSAPHVGRWVSRVLGGHYAQPAAEGKPAVPRGGVVVVGFGPAGQAVGEALHSRGLGPVIVLDSNPSNRHHASRLGYEAHLADATSAEVWRHLHAGNAGAIVVTVPDHRASVQIVHQAKLHAPNVPIIARARYHAFASDVARAGAVSVVDEESVVGKRLGREATRTIRSPRA